MARDREPVPDSVEIRSTPRVPVQAGDLGITVDVDRRGSSRHRLVTIGGSLTHGFQSGALFNTDLSYPAIIAHELGWAQQFRYPKYPGYGGIPLNIELLIARSRSASARMCPRERCRARCFTCVTTWRRQS